MGMNSTIGHKSDKMNFLPVRPRIIESFVQNRIVIELSFVNSLVNLDKILINNTSGSDVHVSNLRVSHLSLGEADSKARCFQPAMRISVIERVNKGCLGFVNSGNFLVAGDTPPVENHQ